MRTLAEASAALDATGYRTHEFGDSVLIEKSHVKSAAATLGARRLKPNSFTLTGDPTRPSA